MDFLLSEDGVSGITIDIICCLQREDGVKYPPVKTVPLHGNDDLKRERRRGMDQNLPAIVIAAFGTSRRGKSVYDILDQEIRNVFWDYGVHWAYTSKIIRRKTGNPGLGETLASVAAQGFRSAAVLPLQIFPGTEYLRIVKEAGDCQALHCCVGRTLMHDPVCISEVIRQLESGFLSEEEGLNLLALHGTADRSSRLIHAYSAVFEHVKKSYPNVYVASLEGQPDLTTFLYEIGRGQNTAGVRVRLIPMMFTAGLHVEEDLMGEGNSWKNQLEQRGFRVECQRSEETGENLYRGLASISAIRAQFISRLQECVKEAETQSWR